MPIQTVCNHSPGWNRVRFISQASIAAFLFPAILLFAAVASATPQPPDPPPLERPKPPPAQISSSEGMPPAALPGGAAEAPGEKESAAAAGAPDEDSLGRRGGLDADAERHKGLLEWISQQMNVHFSSNIKPFGEISIDPAQNPILYRSGYKPFTLSRRGDRAAARLSYSTAARSSSTPLVGNPNAYQSAVKAALEILPDRPVYRLRMDHPVFHSFYEISKSATATGW